jgi:hypothetical protein
MGKKAIEQLLKTALLEDGEMVYALYEHELEEEIGYFKQSLRLDNDDLIFTVTTNRGHVAMLLINKRNKIYINEAARDELKKQWQANYAKNMERLIPNFAAQLARNELPMMGVRVVSPDDRKKFPRTWQVKRPK